MANTESSPASGVHFTPSWTLVIVNPSHIQHKFPTAEALPDWEALLCCSWQESHWQCSRSFWNFFSPLFIFILEACLHLVIVFPKYCHIWFFPKISTWIAELRVEISFFPYTQIISGSQLISFAHVPVETSQLLIWVGCWVWFSCR